LFRYGLLINFLQCFLNVIHFVFFKENLAAL
jgi:hypothetical protein